MFNIAFIALEALIENVLIYLYMFEEPSEMVSVQKHKHSHLDKNEKKNERLLVLDYLFKNRKDFFLFRFGHLEME